MPSRYQLYEAAVQQPELMIGFIRHAAARLRAVRPVTLREDFCGTGNLASQWVAGGTDRRAIGVDRSGEVLRYAARHHRRPLGEGARRLRLVRGDVTRCNARADVTLSLNFSHCIYKTRRELLRYFRHARTCLNPRGFFICDIYGGPGAMTIGTDTRRLPGFTYLWEQASYNPRTAEVVNHIHFRLPGGRVLRRAFTYRWRLWSIPELMELLAEAGFGEPRIAFETPRGFEEDVDTSGLDAWVAYLVAPRGPRC